MQKFQDTFETCKRSFISAFSIYITVPLGKVTNFILSSLLKLKNQFILSRLKFHQQ